MRISVATVIAIAIGVAAFSVSRDEGTSAAAGSLTLVGDSLNVGIEPYLGDALPGWTIDPHDLVGRTTAEGIQELRRLGSRLAPVVVVSLGTNDAEGSEERFRRLVGEAVEIVGPGRCLVWATIVRNGAARNGFDLVLHDAESEHANVRLVEWGRMVAEDRSLLAGDLVHGTPEGYSRRAEETARVVRACPT